MLTNSATKKHYWSRITWTCQARLLRFRFRPLLKISTFPPSQCLLLSSSPRTVRTISFIYNIQDTNNIIVAISLIPQIQYLLASQIDILIYQGNLDLACNTAGAKRWTSNMPWKGQSAFVAQELKPWKGKVNGKTKKVGTWKEVNIKMVEGDEKRTRFALVTIDGSGHLVSSNG